MMSSILEMQLSHVSWEGIAPQWKFLWPLLGPRRAGIICDQACEEGVGGQGGKDKGSSWLGIGWP